MKKLTLFLVFYLDTILFAKPFSGVLSPLKYDIRLVWDLR